MASTILACMNYTMGTNSEGYTAEDYNAVRSIYTCVLYRSNYGKSCAGKTYEELVAMKSFFDVCFQYEIDSRRCRKASLTSVDASSLKLINSSKREGGGGERKGFEPAFGFDGRRYPNRWRMRRRRRRSMRCGHWRHRHPSPSSGGR